MKVGVGVGQHQNTDTHARPRFHTHLYTHTTHRQPHHTKVLQQSLQSRVEAELERASRDLAEHRRGETTVEAQNAIPASHGGQGSPHRQGARRGLLSRLDEVQWIRQDCLD